VSNYGRANKLNLETRTYDILPIHERQVGLSTYH